MNEFLLSHGIIYFFLQENHEMHKNYNDIQKMIEQGVLKDENADSFMSERCEIIEKQIQELTEVIGDESIIYTDFTIYNANEIIYNDALYSFFEPSANEVYFKQSICSSELFCKKKRAYGILAFNIIEKR